MSKYLTIPSLNSCLLLCGAVATNAGTINQTFFAILMQKREIAFGFRSGRYNPKLNEFGGEGRIITTACSQRKIDRSAPPIEHLAKMASNILDACP